MGSVYDQLTGGNPPPVSPLAPKTLPTSLPGGPAPASVYETLRGGTAHGPQQLWGSSPGTNDTRPPGVEDSPGNPLSFAFGMAKNVFMDIPEVVGGLTQLVKGVARDVAGGLAQITPGEGFFGVGSGLEEGIEEQGYTFGADFWKNIGGAIAGDYASRYGLNGIDEMRDQIYSNPLTYILDALMVGQAVSWSAKLGVKAGLMGDTMAGKILGLSPDAVSGARSLIAAGQKAPLKPEMMMWDMFHAQDEVARYAVPLSQNPVARSVQKVVMERVLSRTATEARTLWDQGKWRALGIPEEKNLAQGYAKVMQTNLATAEHLGERIPRPMMAKTIFNPWGPVKAAQKLFGINASEFYASRTEALVQLKGILEDGWARVEETGKFAERAAYEKEAIHFMQQTNVPEAAIKNWVANSEKNLTDADNGLLVPVDGMPKEGPIVVQTQGYKVERPWSGTLPIEEQNRLLSVGLYTRPTESTNAYVRVGDYRDFEALGKAYDLAGGGVGHVDWVTPHTPPSMANDAQLMARRREYWIRLAKLDDAAGEVPKLEQTLNADFVAFIPYTEAPGEWYSGLHGVFRDRATGDQISISFTTPELLEAQKRAGYMMKHARPLDGIVQGLEERLFALRGDKDAAGNLLQPMKIRQTERKLQKVIEEQRAAREYASQSFRGFHRAYHNPDGYDPMLKMVDDLYLWQQKWGMEPFVDTWMKDHPLWWEGDDKNPWGYHGPYTEAANRAMAPVRIELFEVQLAGIEKSLKEIITKKGRNPAELDQDVYTFLENMGLTKPIYEMRNGVSVQVGDDIIDKVLDDWFATMNRRYPSGPLKDRPILNPRRERFVGADEKIHETRRPVVGADTLGYQTDIEQSATYLRDRIRAAAWEHVVLNGDLNGYNWESLRMAMPQMPAYYPHLRVYNMKDSDLFASKLRPESLETFKEVRPTFMREFEGRLWAEGAASMNLEDTYTRMASQMLRHKEIADAVHKLKKFGRQLSEEELRILKTTPEAFEGEVMWVPEGSLADIKVHGAIMDLRASIQAHDDLGFFDATEKALNTMRDEFLKLGDDRLTKMEVYMIPKHVVDHATKSVLRGFAPGPLRMFWDGPRNLWRASVLAMNPRWIIMNEMGNIMMTLIKDPAAIRRIFGNFDRQESAFINTITSLIESEKYGGSARAVIGRGFYGSEAADVSKIRNWGAAAETYPRLTQKLDRIYNSLAAKPVKWWTREVRSLGTAEEQAARLGISLSEYQKATIGNVWDRFRMTNMDIARKIAKEGVNPQVMDSMLTVANKVLGDYTTLSPFERDVVRRFIMPFYPFYRHITKFTLKMPFQHPLKSQVLRELEMLDREMGNDLPEYLGGAVYVGKLAGMDLYWNTRAWNPMNNFEMLQLEDVMDPWIKTGIQWALGINDFGDPYDPDVVGNNVYEAGNGMLFKNEGGTWVPFEGRVHPPLWKMALGQFGTPANFLNLKGYKSYHPATTAAGMMGLSLSRFDTAKYQQNILEGMEQALKYGGQP